MAEKLYNLYDTQNEGKVYIKDLVESICNENEDYEFILFKSVSRMCLDFQDKKLRLISTSSTFCNFRMKDTFNKLKLSLKEMGTKVMINLFKELAISDNSGTNLINLDSFTQAFHKSHIKFLDYEINFLFDYFDKDKSRLINYVEFCSSIKHQLNSNRRKLLVNIFDSLDVEKSGVLSLEALFHSFKGSQHPEVLKGIRHQEVIEKDFFDALEAYINKKSALVNS